MGGERQKNAVVSGRLLAAEELVVPTEPSHWGSGPEATRLPASHSQAWPSIQPCSSEWKRRF